MRYFTSLSKMNTFQKGHLSLKNALIYEMVGIKNVTRHKENIKLKQKLGKKDYYRIFPHFAIFQVFLAKSESFIQIKIKDL